MTWQQQGQFPMLGQVFEFLRDRDFDIDRRVWNEFCRDRAIDREKLRAYRLVLWEQLEAAQEREERRAYLEQLLCCDPFDLARLKELRDLWHDKSQEQLEPFQEWAYDLSLHIMQVSAAVIEPELIPPPAIGELEAMPPEVESGAIAAAPPPSKSKFVSAAIWLSIPLFLLGIGLASRAIFNSLDVFSPIPAPESNPSAIGISNFPMDSCGDRDPGGVNVWYPVFVEYSEVNLFILQRDYCRDAFRKRRTGSGIASIQVSSFRSRERAEEFARILGDRLGNAEVGEPTIR